MHKFIPLLSLKDTTGIIELCKKAGEPVGVNRNGELKLVIMTKIFPIFKILLILGNRQSIIENEVIKL